jgi:hypothetical protein
MQRIIPLVVTHVQDQAISFARGEAGTMSAAFGLAGFDDGFFVIA